MVEDTSNVGASKWLINTSVAYEMQRTVQYVAQSNNQEEILIIFINLLSLYINLFMAKYDSLISWTDKTSVKTQRPDQASIW